MLMSVLLAAAWVMTALHFSAYFAALTATATLTTFSGVRVLRRKRPDIDPRQRATVVDWIVTLAVLAIGVWVLTLVMQGQTGNKAAVSAALVYACFTYGGWDLWRFLRPADWPFSPNLWTYEHLVKMLSAYGAVISAFSGNYLTFLPTPWSQLWPSLLFQPMAVIWILVLLWRQRRRPGSLSAAA
jgi:cation transport ATPase